MPDLIYKYINSVSPVNESCEIKGMIIFYALNEDNEDIESFFDRQIKGGKKISPQIEMLPLSENVSDNKQNSNAIEMLRILMENVKTKR